MKLKDKILEAIGILMASAWIMLIGLAILYGGEIVRYAWQGNWEDKFGAMFMFLIVLFIIYSIPMYLGRDKKEILL